MKELVDKKVKLIKIVSDIDKKLADKSASFKLDIK